MSEANEGAEIHLRRVAMDLPGQHVPELMSVLGEFAARNGLYDFRLQITDIPSGVSEEPSQVVDKSRFDAEKVVWLYDSDTDSEVAVTTEVHLREAAQKKFGSTRVGQALSARLFGPPEFAPRALWPFLLIDHTNGSVIGLRTESVPSLLAAMRAQAIILKNQGPKAIELLETYPNLQFSLV
jgi:hypothetical protein